VPVKPDNMKTFALCFLCIFICITPVFGQIPEVIWEKQLDLKASHYFTDVIESADGTFILLGAIEQPGERKFDLWILHCSSNGDTLRTKVFAGAGNDIPMRILSAGDNGYLLASMNEGSDSLYRSRLISLDSGFSEKWIKEGEQPSAVLRTDVAVDSIGQIWWLNTFPDPGNKPVVSVMGMDFKGNINLEVSFDEDTPMEGYSIRALPDGTLGISCRKQQTGGKSSVQVVKLSNDGKTVWKTTLPNEGRDQTPQCLCCSPDNTLLIGGWAGLCYNPDAPSEEQIWDYDYLLSKIDAGGKVIWTQNYNREGSERGTAVAVLPDGNIMAAGRCETSFTGSIGPWLLLIDKNGKMIKDQVYKFRFVKDQAARIIYTADGGFLMVGPGFVDTENRLTGWVKKLNHVM
jgi:hypothetical protein